MQQMNRTKSCVVRAALTEPGCTLMQVPEGPQDKKNPSNFDWASWDRSQTFGEEEMKHADQDRMDCDRYAEITVLKEVEPSQRNAS